MEAKQKKSIDALSLDASLNMGSSFLVCYRSELLSQLDRDDTDLLNMEKASAEWDKHSANPKELLKLFDGRTVPSSKDDYIEKRMQRMRKNRFNQKISRMRKIPNVVKEGLLFDVKEEKVFRKFKESFSGKMNGTDVFLLEAVQKRSVAKVESESLDFTNMVKYLDIEKEKRVQLNNKFAEFQAKVKVDTLEREIQHNAQIEAMTTPRQVFDEVAFAINPHLRDLLKEIKGIGDKSLRTALRGHIKNYYEGYNSILYKYCPELKPKEDNKDKKTAEGK